MDIKNEDGGKLWIMAFIGELLHCGLDESELDIFDRVELLSNELPNKKSFFERVINYFDGVDEPFDELMEIIGFSIPYESVGIEERVKIIGKMDKREFSFIPDLIIEDSDFYLINSACILYMVGARNNANAIIKIAIKSIIKNAFTPIIKRMEINKEIKFAISKSQSEKASKKRNHYYDEVSSVIKLTWEKYPCASKTGIIDSLALHYKGKVSRGAITTWIDESGLRPPRPDKYTSFELVFPQ
ncbi:TPA: hypothetical protein ACPZQZ_000566 [Yersinia enterocolitica]|uniref:hypothetical protein n=1 Tax=Yersinia enterocolitica TaxID=630 RepID=UPI0002FD1704|nr:hypothetical protein [Yersinia enterocolitica]